MTIPPAFSLEFLEKAKPIVEKLPVGDQVLLIQWDLAMIARAQAVNPQHTKQALINILRAHGGTNLQINTENNSHDNVRSMFHFRRIAQLDAARTQVIRDHPWAIGPSAALQQAMNLPHRDAAGQTVKMSRLTARELDYCDAHFFCF